MSISGNWEHRRVEAVSRMSEMDRRTFVKLSGASAAALILGYGPFTDKVWAAPRFSDYPFKLGIASGATRCRTASCCGPASHPTR